MAVSPDVLVLVLTSELEVSKVSKREKIMVILVGIEG
jgi:hypothetical protein